MMKSNPLPGSYTWQTWLWYRRDGTPRRKWKGSIYGELIKVVLSECHLWNWSIVAVVSVLAVGYQNVKDIFQKIAYVCWLIEIQRLDASFSSYDLSSRRDLIAYLANLAFVAQEPTGSERKRFIELMELVLEILPETHALIRGELEKIHHTLSQNYNLSPFEMALAIDEIVRDLAVALINLPFGIGREVGEDKSDGESNRVFKVIG